jgi:ComF family protein
MPMYGSVCGTGDCVNCREQPPVFDRCRSLFRYEGLGARIVHVLKYENGTWLRPEIQHLTQLDPRWDPYFTGSVLVPVPLHARKLRARGYNQAEVITAAISRAFPGTGLFRGLKRVRMTPSQTFLSREQRQRNMRDAFACRESPPHGPLVLVDDVHTTGATLNAAAHALRQAGAANISAFTLAHG